MCDEICIFHKYLIYKTKYILECKNAKMQFVFKSASIQARNNCTKTPFVNVSFIIEELNSNYTQQTNQHFDVLVWMKPSQGCCPYLNQGGQIMPTSNTDTPGFSDLPTALALTNVKLNRQRRKSRKSNFLCDMGAGDIVQKCGAIASFSNRNSFLSNKEIPAPGYQALAD